MAQANPLRSAEAAGAWFKALPQADPQLAVDEINRTLAAVLESRAVAATVLLQATENLRQPITELSARLSARYAGKSLPLSEPQRAAFAGNITLAWTLAYLYYSLIESAGPSGALAGQGALLHQRALCWTVQGMEEHLRARQCFADEDWDLAQFVLQSAAQAQLLHTPVRDGLHPLGTSSAGASYMRLLLLHLAGARTLGLREFECASEMAHYMEAKTTFTFTAAEGESPGEGENAAIPKTAGGEPMRLVRAGALVHFLDALELSRSLRGRYNSLSQGRMFDRPAFSKPLTPAALKNLIAKLHTAWCAPANLRKYPRRITDDRVYAAFSLPDIYALMKRREYVPPPPPRVYGHHEVAFIYLRQDDAQHKQHMHTPETWRRVKAQLETWQSRDQSATGMRLSRRGGGAQVQQGQLMALRLGDGGTAVVGVVRWATQSTRPAGGEAHAAQSAGAADGEQYPVDIGIHILPGLARAGAVRHVNNLGMAVQEGEKSGPTPALILDNFTRSAARANDLAPRPAAAQAARQFATQDLPTLTALTVTRAAPAAAPKPTRYSEQATLLLPAGWVREGEVFEFVDGALSCKLRAAQVTQRYGEIERVQFQMVE